jgi:predicted nucleic acid-binding protein
MTVYVDTSVVLRVLLREPNPVRIWGQWNKAYSSALWRVEALRTVDRLRLTHEIL